MLKKLLPIAALASLPMAAALPMAAQAQQHAYVIEKSLSVDAAREAAQAALETCRKNGFNVTVTVVNKWGRVKAVLSDDNTGPHTNENSFRKAYTSITFKANSGDFGKRIGSTPPPHAALVLPNITTAEGALLILSGKEIVGAIGVSGAPGGDKDAVCAQAGIDRISKGLQ
jgi:uncharacterized protein GlcG (DUF336 family)